MKKYICFMIFYCLIFLIASTELQSQDESKIPLRMSKYVVFPLDIVTIFPDSGTTFLYGVESLFTVWLDNTYRLSLILTHKDSIKISIPLEIKKGNHTLKVEVDDGPWGEIAFEVKEFEKISDTTVNKHDPNPETQVGKPKIVGKEPSGKVRGNEITNPPGGHNRDNSIPCFRYHRIDGLFTDSIVGTIKEWSGITPLVGAFAYLYLDYCDLEKTLYVMNDWRIGTGNYDTATCYNEFEFITGNGSENWHVIVYNDVYRGVQVIRNGIDVSNDSNYIVGGQYGFNASLLEEEDHTMWEFGLKVKSGLYIMHLYRDEVAPVIIEPKAKIICDKGGIKGWGLVPEPTVVSGTLGSHGTKVRNNDRYIPLGGVAGLVREPTLYGGEFFRDTATIFADGYLQGINKCKDNHVIDGQFTKDSINGDEWSSSSLAIGKYSNLYAEYCNGKLYILNDWVLGTREPDERNCYNLFEMYTGNGSEHWGIFVYHDINRGIKVFRNGIDVSDDSTIVHGGRFGFSSSLLEEEEHTIYEFSIVAEEGAWHLFLCDPGPSSFCDDINDSIPRKYPDKIFPKQNGENVVNSIDAKYNDEINLTYGIEGDMSEWYSRKFKAVISYDYYLFYPIIPNSDINNQRYSNLDSISYIIEEPGKLVIEGIASENFTSNNDIFFLDGIVLAGYDSVATISGTLLLGNRSDYMKSMDLEYVSIKASSECPSTNNLVKYKGQNITSFYLSPNPIDNSQVLNLDIESNKNVSIDLTVYDYNGMRQNFYNSQYLLNTGSNTLFLDMNRLNTGLYLIKISENGHNYYQQFIISK